MTNKYVRGAGGGKGGKKGRSAQESANTLRSRQIARVLDLLCEGEIEGLVGSETSVEMAERSIYFDGVPLRNEAGQPNFDLDAFSWAFVPGVQHQPVIPTGGAVSSEIVVNQQVKAGNTGGGPVVRSIPELYIDACRVTVMVPRLTHQNTTNGDLTGSSVTFSIEVQSNGGGFVTVMSPTISGKTNSEYQRSYQFDLPGDGPWDIRVNRLTPDSDTSNVSNDLHWSTYTKIVKTPLSYPNTAMMGVVVDSALFNKIPSRAYKLKLLRVSVPSNYFPNTRKYTRDPATGADTGVEQIWNGEFYTAWTDNPAWCWYDLATNDRYGLGEYLDAEAIDKWTLYSIARYCDELVPDGFGGFEPRFTCNLAFQKREEAFKVLMHFASLFRGIVYWHTNTIFCAQDRPDDPVKLFTPANVENGEFSYSGSSRQTRSTVAIVAWNDPEDGYKQTLEYVEDRDAILKYGVRETEVTAIGCISRGQANRFGKWTLLTSSEETDTVTFKTGLEGAGVMPGSIIQTSDPGRAGERMGGRILSATANQIVLDAPVTLEPGKQYKVAVVLPAGAIDEKDVAWSGSVTTETDVLQFGTPLADVPQMHAIWILQTETLLPELWRVVSVTEADKNMIQISAVEHIPGKYAAIEQGIKLQPRDTSNIALVPGAVTNLKAITDVKKLNEFDYTTRIFVSWTPPASGASRYYVSWRRDSDNAHTQPSEDPSFDIDDVAAGTFTISVTAENAIGLQGPSASITHVVDESDVEPDVQNVRLNPDFNGPDCPITWDRMDWATKYTVQVWSGGVMLREEPVLDNVYVYTYGKNVSDGGPKRSLSFKVKAHSWRGASANWATLDAANPAPAVPSGILTEAGPGQVSIMAERPSDTDLVGMIVWMHTDSTVPATDGYAIYKGTDNAFTKVGLSPGIPMYFKVAFYDSFGTSGLNVSSSVMAVPTATGGIVMVTELPLDPDAVGGQTAVFLDVADVNIRGLYGWNGSAWDFTRDGGYLVERSVTAEKINAQNLAAISADLGTMTAGNFTLNALGFIRGGAVSYSAGTGIWMGYDGGKYKFRAGVPGSSRFEWNGSSFNVYGPDGNLTIASGVPDYTALSNQPTSIGDISDEEAQYLFSIQEGATRNVFRGDWTYNELYAVGDIVMHGGNGWSAILPHQADETKEPPASGNSNTYWTLYTMKGDPGVNGTRTAILDMYKWAATEPTTFPSGQSVYTWSTAQFTEPNTPNGWSLTPPASVEGQTLWLVRQLYSDQQTTSQTTVTWSASVATPAGASGAQGDPGANGTRTAFLEMYKWSIATPTTFPSGTSTYTWATGQFTAPATLNGWSLLPGAVVPGATLWACSVRKADTDTTAQSSVSWTGVSSAYAVGAAGSHALTAIMSNESHTLSAESGGFVESYIGSGTTIQVFEGTTALNAASSASTNGSFTIGTPVVSPAGALTPGIRQYAGSVATVNNHSAMLDSVDSATVTYPITVKMLNGTTQTFNRVQTITKSKAGADGGAGAALVLLANRATTFTATDGTLDPSQANIVFTASLSGVANPTYAWTFSGFQTNPVASTTSSQTITAAQFGTSKSATVTCTVNGEFSDMITIVRLEKSTAVAGATKNTIYRQATEPAGAVNGDIWINTINDEQKMRVGGSWQLSATIGADSSNLKSGRGVNLLFNAGFSLSVEGWSYYADVEAGTFGRNMAGWMIPGRYGTFYARTITNKAYLYINRPNDVPVIPGRRYEAYIYSGAHRCDVSIYIDFWDAAGNNLGSGSAVSYINSGTNYETHSGGTSLSGYKQIGTFATAPANAATARMVVHKSNTKSGGDSYMFLTLPYFGEAAAGQTEPSPWNEGSSGINQKITAGNASTFIDYAAINAAQIGSLALTGNGKFSVLSDTTGGNYMDMNSQRIAIVAGGVLRVKIGNLDA